MNAKQQQGIAEAKIITKFLELGYSVSIPMGKNQQYNLIFETAMGILEKVLAQTGTLASGVISISMPSELTRISPSKGKPNFIAVYCPETDECYLVPLHLLYEGACYLTPHDETRNPSMGIFGAEEYKMQIECEK